MTPAETPTSQTFFRMATMVQPPAAATPKTPVLVLRPVHRTRSNLPATARIAHTETRPPASRAVRCRVPQVPGPGSPATAHLRTSKAHSARVHTDPAPVQGELPAPLAPLLRHTHGTVPWQTKHPVRLPRKPLPASNPLLPFPTQPGTASSFPFVGETRCAESHVAP